MTHRDRTGPARQLARLAALTTMIAALAASRASAGPPASIVSRPLTVASASAGPWAPTVTRWLATWSPSPVEARGPDIYYGMAFLSGQAVDQSIRSVIVVTSPGERIRIRVTNRYGDAALRIAHVVVGRESSGPAVVVGSSRSVSFAGRLEAAVPAGADLVSDSLRFAVQAGDQLAVSMDVVSSGRVTFHKVASAMSYVSPAGSGDQTSDEEGSAYTRTAPSWFWLAGVDTESSWPGTIVALGDSITDGYLLLPDQQETWPAVLATRLRDAAPAQRHAVVNAGISGNELTGSLWPEYGASAVSRVNADGLDLAGVTSLIVFEGTNDLSHGVTALQVVVALDRIAVQARRHGVRVFGATITPRTDLSWNRTTMESAREAVNQWIRTSGAFDGVLDFDRVLRDPANPHQLAPAYDTDGLHPNPLGLRVLAQSIDLSLFA